ncbi:MAG: D-alanyl-D-alanine carboxypeptidase [Rhizobiales bacterium]|nr:D-alanyl-D-alanine carboxypeptidase [Hyphomicrobiales bacterium]MBI3674780.1 D-alanyl-D-alanine carboxypeptidase [Hyphomicrobiales bacterium]
MPVFLRRLIVAATLIACSAATAGAAGPSLLFDPATGEVLSSDRAGEPWYPASITKLMTSYLVFRKLKTGALKLDQKIPVSATAYAQPPSKIGVPVGGSVSVDFAVQSLLVYSANDMAYVLAEAASGTPQAFVAEMNTTARELGMSGSHFVNPNGLFEPRQVTTARDMAVLAMAILRDFPEYAHYFSQSYLKVGKRRLASRNSLIRQMPEADGMKTGFVCDSGFNLVASATRNGRKLVAVVFGAQSGKARADLAQMLLVDGFARAPGPAKQQLADIANAPLGSLVPANLSKTVCKQEAVVNLADPNEMTGWAISLGEYDSAEKADMALRGYLLSPGGRDAGGSAGVLRIPDRPAYAAVLWDLDQTRSGALCALYRGDKAYCDVMTPAAIAAIAALTPAPKPSPTRPEAQGSDDDRNKAKAPDREN